MYFFSRRSCLQGDGLQNGMFRVFIDTVWANGVLVVRAIDRILSQSAIGRENVDVGFKLCQQG